MKTGSVMKTEMEKTEPRELTDAELDIVSGGSFWGGLASAIGGGALGGIIYTSNQNDVGRRLY
jgi:hypothetical protein